MLITQLYNADTRARVPYLRSLFTVPPEGEDIVPCLQVYWYNQLIHQCPLESCSRIIDVVSSLAKQSCNRRRKLVSLWASGWIFVKESSPHAGTVRYGVLCPLGAGWKCTLSCSVCNELSLCALISSCLYPLLVTCKLEGSLLEAFLSKTRHTFLWDFT